MACVVMEVAVFVMDVFVVVMDRAVVVMDMACVVMEVAVFVMGAAVVIMKVAVVVMKVAVVIMKVVVVFGLFGLTPRRERYRGVKKTKFLRWDKIENFAGLWLRWKAQSDKNPFMGEEILSLKSMGSHFNVSLSFTPLSQNFPILWSNILAKSKFENILSSY